MLLVLAWLMLLVAAVLCCFGGWALVALRGRDGEHDRRPGTTWAVLAIAGLFLFHYGIRWIEAGSALRFGIWNYCVLVLLFSGVGAAACWLAQHRSTAWD